MTADATKLASVNEMLTSTGTLRANSLGSSRPDVLLAQEILDQTDRSVQGKGWHWNSKYNQTLTPTTDNEIELTQDIFEVHESSGQDSPTRRQVNYRYDLAKRGSRLYNVLDDTFTFTAPVTVNMVLRVDFEDLPQYAREYITKRAAREFFEITRGQPSRIAEDKEIRARADMMSAEYRSAQFNMFHGPDTSWPDLRR